MLENYPDVMTPEQTAEILQLSVEEIEELLVSSEIPAKKIGKFWRIPKNSLINFLNPSQTSENTDTSDINLKKVPNVEHKVESPDIQVDNKVYETSLEIRTRFKIKIEHACIQYFALKEPDFKCSEGFTIAAKNTWNIIKSKYENAKKINELDKKFGRTHDIISTFLKSSSTLGTSETYYRHLAYLYWLNEDNNKAIEYYKKATWITKKTSTDDWYNIAILTANTDSALACYALEKFFISVSLIEFETHWYLYLKLIQQHKNYISILRVLECSNRKFTPEEQAFLLESGIYFLQLEKKETSEFIKRLLEKSFLHETAIDVFRLFDASPSDSLNQVYRSLKQESEQFITKNVNLSPRSLSSTPQIKQYSSYSNKKPPLPRGNNSYAQAKRVREIEKNLPKAVELYKKAIQENDNVSSAVMDLASVLAQMGDNSQAIETLIQNKSKVLNSQAADNLLCNLYQKNGDYKKASDLLGKILKEASQFDSRRTQLRWQIAYCEMKQNNYSKAERYFREVIRVEQDNIPAKRNLAICLVQQNRFNDAENILEKIPKSVLDDKTLELFHLVKRVTSGDRNLSSSDNILIQNLLSDYTSQISDFAKFFLLHCNFKGIEPNRIQEKEDGKRAYIAGSQREIRGDLQKLEDIAKELGTRRPLERAEYYLSAAKITELESSNQFYQYLCRSFTSKADAIISEKGHLDSAKELYCESLSVYDGYSVPSKEDAYHEQDAVNSLCRFLFACLGRDKIPTIPPKRDEKASILEQQENYIKKSLTEVITTHPKKDQVFDAITYLIFRSRYASNRILTHLFNDKLTLPNALEYLKNRTTCIDNTKKLEDFIPLWNTLSQKHYDNAGEISTQLGFIRNNFKLTTATIEEAITHTNKLTNLLFFDLDKQRIISLQKIFNHTLELCKKSTFEDKERLCEMVKSFCQDSLKEIENSPTRLSIEQIYPVIEIIHQTICQYLDEVYNTSTPELIIRLAEDMDSYTPRNTSQIEVQVVISNKKGCSPAESLKILVIEQSDNTLFLPIEKEVNLDSSLRGGDSRTVQIPLKIFKEALEKETFSLPIKLIYDTRKQEKIEKIESFSIRLYSQDDFEEIDNPYASYAEGGIVGNREMFYGRDGLINNIANALQRSKTESKCIVIFGQKRAGKSSTLTHLKSLLEKEVDNLVLENDIGSIIDDASPTPFLYQILWSILSKFRYAIEDKIDDGFPSLELSFPNDIEFYQHPNQLNYFKSIFDEYKRKTAKLEKWNGLRIVLLIDEFTYIYSHILKKHIPESFMKNWKSLLQANYFNAVLVGQDVMTKFKERFPNEFGTTQDERVSYLKEEDARRLIDEPIRIGGREGKTRYVERAIGQIIDLTAGSPFYIQIICNRLVEYMNSKHSKFVSDADVERIKYELIHGVNALDLDKFDNLINSGDASQDAIKDADILKVLKEIARNTKNNNMCNRDNISCETDTPIDDILNDLVKRDVLERNDSYYRIRVGLFKEWLIAHS